MPDSVQETDPTNEMIVALCHDRFRCPMVAYLERQVAVDKRVTRYYSNSARRILLL